MKAAELRKIGKLCFGYEDIARVLHISLASAKVSASRYTKQGVLLRLKRNMYVLRETWKAASREDKFRLANLGQVPSYISLTTALEYFEVTTQLQRDFFESVAVRRSKQLELDGTVFRYVKLTPQLYDGFRKERTFFIATPEKAFLDAIYLMSHGRYSIDLAAVDAKKLDRRKIERLSRQFPPKTEKTLKQNGYL